MDISIIIPVYNEEKNLEILQNNIKKSIKDLKLKYEIIYINDGSTDNSQKILEKIKKENKNIRIIKLIKNCGQTTAMNIGFQNSKGKIIIPMDADLQNDPKDIPRLLEKLNQGYDVICGWRYNRKDPLFTKKIPSKLAYIIKKKITGDKIHDTGCTLKAIRSYTLRDITLYGETHRFIPTILKFQGYKIGEIKVNHFPRRFGKTKYNSSRYLKGFFDLINITFWHKFSKKPLHFFGKMGFHLISLSIAIFIYIIIKTLIFLKTKPTVGLLLLFSIMLFLSGLQIILFGLISEMIIKIYYKNSNLNKKIKKNH